MTWREKMMEWGAGNLTFLSSDGATLIFVAVGEPEKLEGKYKNKPQDRVAVPVVTDEGFSLFITGKRCFRKIVQFEDRFKDAALIVTRHGVEGDINASYEVAVLDDAEKTKHLLDLAKAEYTPEAMEAALKDAQEMMKQ